MNVLTYQALGLRLLAMGIPLGFGLSAMVVSTKRPFQRATQAAGLGLALALVVAALDFATPERGELTCVSPTAEAFARFVRLDVVTHVMSLLVTFVAFVVVRYSRTYLQGEAGQVRYARALSATLSAVTVLILSNHLLVVAVAWMATSVAVHQLLTFYQTRPQALVAAHKKFILSRFADACMVVALVLLRVRVGSLDLDAVNEWASARESLPLSLHVAAVFLAAGVALKSAQLPFHGWLIQVMEAPTPVSALLHAGIVNIGGFVMIRLAPFMGHAVLAQSFLVVVGMVTTVVAALVMTTRVSVKVALAWSTCAQMGFMLVECGVGAWDLALLHLVAHSLYKAHAFLSSGMAVDVWRVEAITEPHEPVAASRGVAAAALAMAVVVASVAGVTALVIGSSTPTATFAPLAILLMLSLSVFVVRAVALDGGLRAVPGIVFRCAFVSALYVAGHMAAARLLRFPEPASRPFMWVFVSAGFAALCGVQVAVAFRPNGKFASAIQPRLFAGLYLDEVFTRMTFWIWPPKLRPSEATFSASYVEEALEAR